MRAHADKPGERASTDTRGERDMDLFNMCGIENFPASGTTTIIKPDQQGGQNHLCTAKFSATSTDRTISIQRHKHSVACLGF